MRRFASLGILALFFSLCLFVGPAMAAGDDDIPGTPLSIGSALSGTTSAGDANDVYAVTLTAGEEVHIQCDPGLTDNTGGTFHLLTPGVISLSDPDDYDELAYTLSGGSPIRYWADYDYIPAKSGTYYLWVEWSEGSLNYQLSITRTARAPLIMAPDSDDIPGTSVGAGTVTGVVSSKADPNDLYAVSLTAGQPVTIRLIPLTPYNNSGSSLAYLSLLDPSTPSISNYYGHRLGERVMATNNMDAASRVTAEIQYTPTQTGTYYIWVEPNPYGYNFAYQLSISVVADTTPALTFTAPSGLGSYSSAQSLTASWNADIDLDAGQFGVWARSAAGSWYIGQLVATNAGDDLLTYSTSLPLTGLPAGFYQVIVGYRPTVGSGSWVSWATSYGFVFSLDAPPTPAVTITQPIGQGTYTSSQSFTATWTASPSLTTGQFAVWVRSPGNTWYWKAPLVAATGAASYSAPVSLTGVTPGLGYQVIVAYEAIANTSLWVSWATSPGVFSVDMAAPTITVTQPSGTTSYNTSQSVTATWTTNQALSGGEFGLWVRSGGGGWYVTKLVVATGSSFSTTLPLSTVPAGLGNEVIVAYRPVVGTGAWMSWATSPGVFTVIPL